MHYASTTTELLSNCPGASELHLEHSLSTACSNVSANLALNSSRRLLGASYANLTQKWESRSPHAPAAADASAEDTAEEGGSSGEGEDLEAPLLPSAGAQQAWRDAAGRKAPLRRISTVTSISSSSAGGMGTHGSVGGSKDMGSARSRAPGTEWLSKYGSGDFSDEAPFWSGQATAPQVCSSVLCLHKSCLVWPA